MTVNLLRLTNIRLWAIVCYTTGALLIAACSSPLPPPPSETGLSKTPCWFKDTQYLDEHTCYYMTVNETPGINNGRRVSFPVIVFEAPEQSSAQAPFLHLGAGGPGAPLVLESEYNVWNIYQELRPLSVDQGRDLYLIDPRGTGQSQPLLMCQTFVDGVIPRWTRDLSLRESYESGSSDFLACITQLKQEGLDFSAYNSETVISDLEQLRVARGVDQWVLYGASYGSVYALLYARDFPARLEAMILDSATFLDIPRHEALVRETVQPYLKLFNYCDFTANCSENVTPERTELRFWQLVNTLDKTPLTVSMEHPITGKSLRFPLSGWRFLDSMLWGVYEEEVFTDFPRILEELEGGETKTLQPYIDNLLQFLLDDRYGDISASSHYCVDQKPYLDEDKINAQIERIPYEYARGIARLSQEFTDYCDLMNIAIDPGTLNQPISTDVPTLFLHGTFDSVTLLEHVAARLNRFDNGYLVTSSQAHIVLDDACVMKTAVAFLKDKNSLNPTQRCNSR